MRYILLALAALLGTAAVGAAQQMRPVPDEGTTKWKNVPAAEAPAPFSTERGGAVQVEFRGVEQMSPQDKLLLADAESSIAEHAGLNGMEFALGGWSAVELVCPALPGHLFVQYTRNGGKGDVSRFSASIPRNGNGRVRVIPIIRRGYSLFAPAPINALTISAFNHIRAEEAAGRQSAGWLGNGMCYAALAGARPVLPAVDAEAMPGKPVPAERALLEVKGSSGETVRFVDAEAEPHPMLWTMTFTAKGKLVKATHTAAPQYTARSAPANDANGDFKPAPANEVEGAFKPVPANDVNGTFKPVPANGTDAPFRPVPQALP